MVEDSGAAGCGAAGPVEVVLGGPSVVVVGVGAVVEEPVAAADVVLEELLLPQPATNAAASSMQGIRIRFRIRPLLLAPPGRSSALGSFGGTE
jgi:hypothetical protein